MKKMKKMKMCCNPKNPLIYISSTSEILGWMKPEFLMKKAARDHLNPLDDLPDWLIFIPRIRSRNTCLVR